LYENYGMQTNYFGGGAGSLSLEQMPCVFSNDGVFQDAAVFALLRMESRIGVRHGWNKVDGPFIVTKAEGNIIKEINWKNPFEVYKQVVETHSNKQFNDDNFFAAESIKFAEKPRKAIIIDCISRILFLEDNFDKELNTITKTINDKFPDVTISGALTLGEISSYGEGFLEFYNKTVYLFLN